MAIKAEGYIQRFTKISLHWIRRVSLCLLAFKGRRLTASDPFHILFALLVLAERNMESFWGRFKDTLRKHFRYWECDDLRSTIEQAIYYFNNERPVRKLKGKPPVPYRTELVA
jgi:hypothetical protein